MFQHLLVSNLGPNNKPKVFKVGPKFLQPWLLVCSGPNTPLVNNGYLLLYLWNYKNIQQNVLFHWLLCKLKPWKKIISSPSDSPLAAFLWEKMKLSDQKKMKKPVLNSRQSPETQVRMYEGLLLLAPYSLVWRLKGYMLTINLTFCDPDVHIGQQVMDTTCSW